MDLKMAVRSATRFIDGADFCTTYHLARLDGGSGSFDLVVVEDDLSMNVGNEVTVTLKVTADMIAELAEVVAAKG